MRLRLLSALVYAAVFLGAAGLGGLAWAGFVALLGLQAVREGQQLLAPAPARSRPTVPALAALALPALWLLPQGERLILPALLACAMLAGAGAILTPFERRSSAAWAANLSSLLAIALPLSYLVALRGLPGQPWARWPLFGWLFLVLALIWINDSAAYLVGRALGKRPFFPTISPKKTWEGALGGLVACGLVAAGLAWLGAKGPEAAEGAASLDMAAAALLGIAVAIAGSAGDLLESFLKRQAGVKDSGRFIPGHGGILDRVDSLLWAAPTAYFLVQWLLAAS